ncbi:zinc finger protein RFP-like [Varanus komodoensis]|uniref:Zinc finger protein RFP-like n=1 Tax=Varanus komodoensis TaxID=61221 RepID=A0A8D2JER3_VARKO|nr:zinc finger protein RFP-like [Varanus komodoensis]
MAAAGSSMQSLRDEASCPICLDYFREPTMIVTCGHNFCQDCLTRSCQDSGPDAWRCPQCRELVDQRHFRANRQLANFVAITKQLSLEARTGAGEGGGGGGGGWAECEKHQEPLKLFCKDDQALICVVCRESRDHRMHAVLPTDEAAEEYKDWIQSQINALKKKQYETVASKRSGNMESEALQNEADNIRQDMVTQFKQLYQLIEDKHLVLLARLEELDKRIGRRREEHNAKLSEECASLENLVHEMEEKCRQPAGEILQGIKGIMQKCQMGIVQKPVSSPPELKQWIKEFKAINVFLQRVTKQFGDTLLSEYQLCKEIVTLNPDTAHPDLCLSQDQKSVRLQCTQQKLPSNPERFDTCTCVLGHVNHAGFTSGTHWWEVEVEERGVWAVGVAVASIKRKGPLKFSPSEGIWALGQLLGGHYQALTSPKHHLLLNRRLRRIRVTLEYDKQQVAFLNPDTDTPIFIFSPASFNGETILPWFWVGGLASQLRLSL